MHRLGVRTAPRQDGNAQRLRSNHDEDSQDRRGHSGRWGAIALPLLVLAGPAAATDTIHPAASPWVASHGSAARLIGAGSRPGTNELLAGLDIRLNPKTITYWRNPGEAGVAPTVRLLAGSTNVASVSMDFPAPSKIDEAGSEAFGYQVQVMFPLHVLRRDPGQPATLDLDLDYAVCSIQCLPAKAHLTLDLPAPPLPGMEGALEEARAKVPRMGRLGEPGPLSISRLVKSSDVGSDLSVEALAGPSAELFLEAPEGWYLEAGKAQPAGPGAVSFPVRILERPHTVDPVSVPVRMTLVDGSSAVEVSTAFDRVAPPP